MQKFTIVFLLFVAAVTGSHTACDTAHTAVLIIFLRLNQFDRDSTLKEAIEDLHKDIANPQTSIDDKMCYQSIQRAYQAQIGLKQHTPFKCEEAACKYIIDINMP
ncbi:unnamed protein product [Bursaphelenchus okinawaensis]|uniref:Uncharacterized protein n=1 Tax=Bursaphelenchus okinawaensis TaxID=465554 RepID=A0A811KR62_9BILA|nr:unnamed protein product [Bursaphelenchus okinawaensis]CAG9109518.1 unnamed protein product [Bursaphelenchus okinawaensis]